MMNARINPYAAYHKALRKVLYDVAVDLGRLDADDPSDVQRVTNELSEVIEALHTHSAHEDEYLHPLLSGWDRLPSLESDHQRLEHELEYLERLCDDMATAPPEERPNLAALLYSSWNVFIARYLMHLEFEETDVLERLWATVEPKRLLEVHMRIVAAQSPVEAERAVRWMCSAESTRAAAALMERVRSRAS